VDDEESEDDEDDDEDDDDEDEDDEDDHKTGGEEVVMKFLGRASREAGWGCPERRAAAAEKITDRIR
jgi:ABC-type Zn2+ transport system substrate-binding protein/surface adhesin